MTKLLQNRSIAGKQLADKLQPYKNAVDTIVLALPRGGVPVAYQIATILNLPFDVFIVRKLGFPDHKEYAMGAIAGNETCLFNTQALEQTNISYEDIKAVISKEKAELERRNELYRQNREMPNLHPKRVIIVDDGIATGASIKVALLALEKLQPKEIILAVPVLPANSINEIELLVDKLIYLIAPEIFYGVGQWYEDFPQVSDSEVIELLNKNIKLHK